MVAPRRAQLYSKLNQKQQFELAQQQQKQRGQALRTATSWCGRIVFVLVLWVPLQAVIPMVADLAGKTTNVSLVATLSLTVSIATTTGYVVEVKRRRKAERELTDVRGRLEQMQTLQLAAVGIQQKEVTP